MLLTNNYDCGTDADHDGELSGCGCAGPEPGDPNAAVQKELDAEMPVVEGSGRVDLATGAVRLSLAPPGGGAFDPRQVLTYNSRNTATGENGRGVTGSLNVKIIAVDADSVDVVNCLGEKIRFGYRDGATNLYRSPPGSTSRLEKIPADGSWQQTNYDGSIVRYDSSGKAVAFADPRSNRWTVSYDGGGRVTGVLNPYGRRMTCAYDGNNKLKSIQDAGARVTSFTVDAGG